MLSAVRFNARSISHCTRKSKSVARFHNSTKLLSKETSSKAPVTKSKPQSQDPHQLASERVRKAPDSRISGSEALESITPEQKMRNYATALGLVSFCTGVWYYSIQAVGQTDGGVSDLRAEAKEAMDALDRKNMEEKNAEELAQLDISMGSYGSEEDDDMIVAVAAPDAIAEIEESALKGSGSNKSGKPLWKKVVFFWRRE